jgi:hypothetical protein
LVLAAAAANAAQHSPIPSERADPAGANFVCPVQAAKTAANAVILRLLSDRAGLVGQAQFAAPGSRQDRQNPRGRLCVLNDP